MSADVTPYVGVWIETEKIYNAEGNVESHPTWVCGLKQIQTEYYKNWFKSHPTWVCGLKQTSNVAKSMLFIVTPYVGVWIETSSVRRLRDKETVTPYVGVWIETVNKF